MQPENVVWVLRVVWRVGEAAVGVFGEDVFEDGACFSEGDGGAAGGFVFDYGGCAGPVEGAVGFWGLQGGCSAVAD